MRYSWQTDRKLETKSFLRFEFPTDSFPNTVNLLLPFFQNPNIKEAKRANYTTYKPISRSSSLYSFMGADSRELNLDFEMTLDHLQEYSINFSKYVLSPLSKTNNVTERLKFSSPSNPNIYTDKIMPSNIKDYLNITETKEVINETNERVYSYFSRSFNQSKEGGYNVERENGFTPQFSDITETVRRFSSLDLTDRLNLIEVVLFWVNLIRSSVTNNAENPLLGPPIIRLNHGVLYKGIPCICTDYSISEETKAGYDVKTLMPKVLKISMKLSEVRAGNFDKFSIDNKLTNPDGIAGWESIISKPYNTDPGRY